MYCENLPEVLEKPWKVRVRTSHDTEGLAALFFKDGDHDEFGIVIGDYYHDVPSWTTVTDLREMYARWDENRRQCDFYVENGRLSDLD